VLFRSKKSFLMTLFLASTALPVYAGIDFNQLRVFLRQYISFTEQDLQQLGAEQAVVRVLDTPDKSEVAVFGIVRVEVPRSYFVERYRDIEHFKSGDAVLAIHKFSDPPRIDDLQDLTADPEDLKAMEKCREGHCDLKLPVSVIARLHDEIDWAAPDHRSKALGLARQVLLSYVNAYLAGGNDALVEYHDKKDARRLADEFRSILRESRYLYDYAPEFRRQLETFPREIRPDIESFLYWSKEKFGLKPVVSVTHSMIYQDNAAERTYIAAKQIYASHYFDASVGLVALLEDTKAPSKPAFYLLYLNRSRADTLRGGFSGLKRSIIEKQCRGALLEVLRTGKEILERDHQIQYPESRPPASLR
jgi:hypothetical protein